MMGKVVPANVMIGANKWYKYILDSQIKVIQAVNGHGLCYLPKTAIYFWYHLTTIVLSAKDSALWFIG